MCVYFVFTRNEIRCMQKVSLLQSQPSVIITVTSRTEVANHFLAAQVELWSFT